MNSTYIAVVDTSEMVQTFDAVLNGVAKPAIAWGTSSSLLIFSCLMAATWFGWFLKKL